MYLDLQWIYLSDPPTKHSTLPTEQARIEATNAMSQTSEHPSSANTEVDYEDMSDGGEDHEDLHASPKHSNITLDENDYEIFN